MQPRDDRIDVRNPRIQMRSLFTAALCVGLPLALAGDEHTGAGGFASKPHIVMFVVDGAWIEGGAVSYPLH